MVSVNTNKENICVNKIVGQKKDFVFVEGDAIVPDIKPDILNIITTTGNAYIYKKEILDGKVRLEGSIDAYVIYLADDDSGSTRGINTNINFIQNLNIDNCTSDMSVDENVEIKTIECNILNERKINVKVGLEISAVVLSNENIDIVTSIENLNDVQSLITPLQITKLVGEGASKTSAKDNISIDEIDNLAEILKVEINIINKDNKISYNKVLAKGDAEVKITYLTEDNRIKTVQNKLQIMGFIDIENVKDDNICDIKYKIKNVLIKPNSVEEHSIYAEIEIELVCRTYENVNIEIMQDLYSPTENLNFTQRNVRTMIGKNNINEIYSIKDRLSVNGIQNNEICDAQVKPIIKQSNILNNRINYEGEIELNFLVKTNQNRIESIVYKMPLNYTINADDISTNSNIITSVDTLVQNFIVLPDGTIDTNIDLCFNVDISNTTNINIIDEITLDDERKDNTYSIIVYFVKEGDTLWKIAKKFRSTIQDIMRINEIEDENKIYTGEQLFIPKYVCNKREISA